MTNLILVGALAATLGDSAVCKNVSGLDPRALLERAAINTGLRGVSGAVLEVKAFDVTQHAYESDRMYPPALAEVASLEQWFDLQSGVERITAHSTIGGYEFS